jgi:RHS repeat-associated protein
MFYFNKISFAKNSAGALQLKDNNDYYPFGMNHLKTGNAYFGAGSYVKYKFGGKELQEFGAYDFGARIYMADIARWSAVDPMAEQNPGLTPYRYGFNNPVMFTDHNGMLEQALIDGMMSQSGTWYNTGMGFTNSSDALKIVNANNYYPFGMKHLKP